MRSQIRPLAVVLAVLMLGSAGSQVTIASGSTGTVYVNGAYQPRRLSIKPHSFYQHVTVHGLQWSNWGSASATAQGTITFQFCVEESCSVSPFYDQPVTVTLATIKSCRGRLSYTRLGLNVGGPMPDSSFTHYRTSLACSSAHAKRR